MISTYFYNLLLGLDRFGNVILAGDPDETISARAGRLRYTHRWTWGVLAWLLDTLQRGHVEGAIEGDELRAEHTEDVEEAAEKKGL